MSPARNDVPCDAARAAPERGERLRGLVQFVQPSGTGRTQLRPDAPDNEARDRAVEAMAQGRAVPNRGGKGCGGHADLVCLYVDGVHF